MSPAWAADEKAVEITVVKNDTVIQLCEKYLDNPSNWPKIVLYNHLQNQDLIHPGQKLLIPIQYLKGVPSPGRVVFLKGDVAFRASPNELWRPLKKEDRVRQGTLIRTGTDGLVEIQFENGTTFTQTQDSLLDIQQSSLKADSSLWQRFMLQGGRLILRVRRALGQEQRMEIHTPAGAAVARGTDFRVSASAQESMTSEVLEGSVDVRGGNRMVALDAGYGTRVIKGEAPLEPRKLLAPPELVDLQDPYRTMPFSLAFKSVSGAVSHRVLLFRDAEGKDMVREKVLPAGQPLEIAGLDDGEYYLSCRSIDNAGIEGFSLAFKKIHVRINPLPPFIQVPSDAATYKAKTVSFNWLSVRDTGSYQIEVAQNRDFSDLNVRRIKT
ncbi:MAG TPA: FecR domain-containing protein, partial [Smithellaceae bacterium]|nr:FecR domain-containing protein [Smithellaceae bacterium]